MKLKFVFNKEYDRATTEHLKLMKRYSDEAIASFDEIYKVSKGVMEKSRKEYQKNWDSINNRFFKLVEEITGYPWMFENYECVIATINPGASNWGKSNLISLFWKLNPYYVLRIVGHELILHHYFGIIRNHYADSGLNDKQIWALSEIAAYTLTSLPKEMKKFWPWHTNYMGSYLPGTAYPQLDELRIKLKKPFLERRNFDDYIKEGIKFVKKYDEDYLWTGKFFKDK